MKPVRLTARNFRSFADLDYSFTDGATAVVGSNGAGKSTLIGAVEVALFGRSGGLQPLVREGCNDMQITLEFEHGGRFYRVRRGWKSGRPTLDLEGAATTQGNATDTQARLEEIIGISKVTFRCSGYLAQRDSDSFTGAAPIARKNILANALALQQWDEAAKDAKTDRVAAEKRIVELDGRITALANQAVQAEDLAVEAGDLRLSVDIEEALEADATATALAQQKMAADLEAQDTAWRLASARVETASARNVAHLAALEASTEAREQIAALQSERERLDRADPDMLEAQLGAVNEWVVATSLKENLAAVAADGAREALKIDAKLARLQSADLDTCETCGQHLADEAAATVAATYNAQLNEIDRRVSAVNAEYDAIVVPNPTWEGSAIDEIDRLGGMITAAKNAVLRDFQLRTRIDALQETIRRTDNDDYRDTARRLSHALAEAEMALLECQQPVPGGAEEANRKASQAAALASSHTERVRRTAERLAAVTALLRQAQTALVEHAAAEKEREMLLGEIDVLSRLEKAFGRDGIPAWIVESQALPQIETEANTILSRLGGAISRVELRTERETKAGDKRDALDIVCMTDEGERALETFSGGEQSRAEIALALGLVSVLQSRRDADLRYLALDEPSGLDQQGTEALAEVLRERASDTVVLLASHDSNLRDQFDSTVVVQRGAAGSEVIV